MKLKKLSLSEIKGKLSRVDMKKIMAGSDAESCNCNSADTCGGGQICGSWCNGGNGYYGHCTTQ